MPGPPPTEPGQRRRRNKPPEFDVLPAEGRTEAPPVKLPRSYRTGLTTARGKPITAQYLAETRRWFDTWASSPQATRFTGTDWQRLVMLAPLVDAYHRGPSKDLAAEIRLQEAALGATWADRQRLRVRVGDPSEDDVEPAGDAPRRRTPRRAVSDRERRLRAV